MVLGDPRIARIHGSDANSEGRRDAPRNILMMTIFRSPYTPRTSFVCGTGNLYAGSRVYEVSGKMKVYWALTYMGAPFNKESACIIVFWRELSNKFRFSCWTTN